MTHPPYYPIELLHWCGMKDEHLYMVQDILHACPEHLNTLNKEQDNALMIAARLNNILIADFLLSQSINPKHKNNEGSALMVAIKYGNKDLVKMMTEKYSALIDWSVTDAKGKTAFHLAALKGYDFLFEVQSHTASILSLDDLGQHCLYDLADGYSFTNNYWCFELIQDFFEAKDLLQVNKKGQSIIEYMNHKIYTGILSLEPLSNILKQKINTN